MTDLRRTPLRRLLLLSALMGGASLVEDTATGNPVTFETDVAKPLVSLIANFLPVQASGTPSPENVLPITGWTGLKVEHFDENLLSINRTSAQSTQGITYTPIKQNNVPVAIKVEGTRTNTNPFFNLNYISKPGGGAGIAIQPGTYKIFGGTSEIRMQVFYHDANGVERLAGYDDGNGATVTIPADCTASWCRLLTWVDTKVDTVIYPIIMSADSSVTVYPATFPSTIYGGYVDLVTGEVWATYGHELFDGGKSNSWSVTVTGSDRLRASFVGAQLDDGKPKNGSTSSLKVDSMEATTAGGVNNAYIGSTGNFLCYPPLETTATKQDWLDYLSEHPMNVVYELETPVLITTLTPQQINAIKGNNTIWSDANSDCSVTFLKKGT